MHCVCCDYKNNYDILFESDYVVCIAAKNETVVGSCFVIPKEHRETPFDLSDEEWLDTKRVIDLAKAYLEEHFSPDGYNLGWNVGHIGGQFVFHSHLHIIPRFKDEPFAGKGIRHWFASDENKRVNQ